MNERIKQLAEQAGFQKYELGNGYIVRKELERFAELVRQDEREACAALCKVQMSLIPSQAWTVNPYQQCIDAIRARGEK
jgi:hypothetical protein